MPKPTKVEKMGYASQVQEWLENKIGEETIAKKLNELERLKNNKPGPGDDASLPLLPVKFFHQDIDRFKQALLRRAGRRAKTPLGVLARKWTSDASDAYDTIQKALEAVDKLATDSSLEPFERIKAIDSAVKTAREKLILLRQYPETGTKVGVQVNIEQRANLWEWITSQQERIAKPVDPVKEEP